MRKILLILFFILNLCHLYSQITIQDHEKYWFYRKRLIKEFLIKGEEPTYICDIGSGLSIPAHSIYSWTGDIHWGEGGIDLGWYIGVLATEYKLLSNYGEPTDFTLIELYYAMKAYERMDRKTEKLFYPKNLAPNCPGNGNLNGLFARDDVDPVIFDYDFNFKQRYTRNDNTIHFKSTLSGQRDRYINNDPDKEGNFYPTADQISGLFVGFALVKKCLPSDLTYNGYNFVEHAQDYTHYITKRLEQNDWKGVLQPDNEYQYGWSFKNEMNAFGIAQAASWITRPRYNDNYTTGIANTTQISGWNVKGDFLAAGLPIMALAFNQHDYSTALVLSFAAISSSWEVGLKFVNESYTINLPCPIFIWGGWLGWKKCETTVNCWKVDYNDPYTAVDLVIVPPNFFGCLTNKPNDATINVTNAALFYYGKLFRQEIFALLHAVLHDKEDNLSSFYKTELETAPCRGSHYKPTYNTSLEGVSGWRASNRWIRPKLADDATDGPQEHRAEWNGLDFMLLYNLYRLHHADDVGLAVYYRDIYN